MTLARFQISYTAINNSRKLWPISTDWNVYHQWEIVAPRRKYRASSCVTSQIVSQLSSSCTNFLDPMHEYATDPRLLHSRHGTARLSANEIWHNLANRYTRTTYHILCNFSPLHIFSELFSDMQVLCWKKVKCKAIRGCPEGCETSRLLHFLDNRLTDGGEIVSLTRRPSFIPQKDSCYSFLLEAESTPGP
jgi:hypothetical protein